MERLTERFSNGQVAVWGCGTNCKHNCLYCNNAYEDCPTINKLYEKLAKFEDLEEQLEKVYGKCDGLLETVINHLLQHEGIDIGEPQKARLLTDEAVDEWEEYKNAKKQGLLLRLPRKVGDTVYEILEDTMHNPPRYIYGTPIEDVSAKSIKYGDEWYEITDRMYFTLAEAEQALARMEGGNV